MQREVRKMERYSKQIRLIVTENLKTIEDVNNYILQTKNNIQEITNLRQKYRNKLRNCKDDELILEYKKRRNECTSALNQYRDKLKIANGILEDVPKIKEVINNKIDPVIGRNKEVERVIEILARRNKNNVLIV